MRDLEETNCQIRETIKFQFPFGKSAGGSKYQDDAFGKDKGSKGDGEVETMGGFLDSQGKYAWLVRETHLTVANAESGECVSQWTFPDRITSVAPFPAQPGEVPLLLVGLDNYAIRIRESVGQLCIFDSSISMVLRIIQLPAGVEKACVVHGGAEWEDYNKQRPNSVLPSNSGLVFVALRNLQHLVIDLDRESWNQPSKTAEILLKEDEMSRNHQNHKPFHLAHNLLTPEIENHIGFNRHDFETSILYDESLCTVIVSSEKTGCLVSGCLGRVIIWSIDGSLNWISPMFDENMYVTHVALLEPADDPRPFYYLWIACQTDALDLPPFLRMYALLFKNKRFGAYYNLEYEPGLKFEVELSEGDHVNALLPIERSGQYQELECGTKRSEDSLLLIGCDERLLLFDLNRWYKEQMPRKISESRNPNSLMAAYPTKLGDARKNALATLYEVSSLRDFPNKTPSSPEELFYPNSLAFDWKELCGDCSINCWQTRGIQTELLREIVRAGPMGLMKPEDIFFRCLRSGLVPFDGSPDQLRHNNDPHDRTPEREMLLSLCLEQRWTGFLSQCALDWSDGSSAYLYPAFLQWGVRRATEIRRVVDRLCVPLFDQSGADIGEAEMRTLRFCAQQLDCLSSVVSKLPNVGTDLGEQHRALKRFATYLQVLLWFHDVGLLPETQEIADEESEEGEDQKIPYPKDKLTQSYAEAQQRTLFVEELIGRECPRLREQWGREVGPESPNFQRMGQYPPSSLQSLLRSFLLDDGEDGVKHRIVMYLLMDLAMCLPTNYPGLDQLIKYPASFKLSPSTIKLTQAFWLLDRGDYDGFFDTVTGQLISDTDIKDWQHRLVLDTLLCNDKCKLAFIYLKIFKPPLSSLEDRGTAMSLAVKHGLVQSAFHSRPPSHYILLEGFFRACKAHGKLKQVMQLRLDREEEEVFQKFLKSDGCEETRLLYYLQRHRHLEARDVKTFNKQNSKTIQPLPMRMLEAYNATLPDITKLFAKISNTKKNLTSDVRTALTYPKPMSQRRGDIEILESAITQTREISGSANYLPFLQAPCSTILLPQTEIHRNNSVVFPVQRSSVNSQIQDNNSRKRKFEMVAAAVCDTPMVVKRPRNDITHETPLSTPQSILKVKHLIRRNSISPSCPTKTSSRQIRFSMPPEPRNISIDSRDETILDDDTFGSPGGPRPRPCLRRSSFMETSCSESESQSEKSSLDNSCLLNISTANITRRKSDLNASRKSDLCKTMYCSTILSSGSSINSDAPNPFSIVEGEEEEEEEDEEDLEASLKSAAEDFENFDSGLPKDSIESNIPSDLRPMVNQNLNVTDDETDDDYKSLSNSLDSNFHKTFNSPIVHNSPEKGNTTVDVSSTEEADKTINVSDVVSKCNSELLMPEQKKLENNNDSSIVDKAQRIIMTRSRSKSPVEPTVTVEKNTPSKKVQNTTKRVNKVPRSTRSTSMVPESCSTPERRKTRASSLAKDILLLDKHPLDRKTRNNSLLESMNCSVKLTRTKAKVVVSPESLPVVQEKEESSLDKKTDKLMNEKFEKLSSTKTEKSVSKLSNELVNENSEKSVSEVSNELMNESSEKSVSKKIEENDKSVNENSLSKMVEENDKLVNEKSEKSASNKIEENDKSVNEKSEKSASNIIEENDKSVNEKSEELAADKPAAKTKRTRAGSVVKENSISERRVTRAQSMASEVNQTLISENHKEQESQQCNSTRPNRKRGCSVPKESTLSVETKASSRLRRSTSLMKDTITEEDSVTPVKTRRRSSLMDIPTNSPSLNTRSRRSSINSVPEDLEAILSVPSAVNKLNESKNPRFRRANSVEVASTPSPRLTRSLLAKATILKDPIPEEAPNPPAKKVTGSPKRLNTRSKAIRENSIEQKSVIVTRGAKRSKKTNEVSENHDG